MSQVVVVEPYQGDAQAWDAHVGSSVNGALVHRRDYLAHTDRFEDRSCLVKDDRGRLLACFPASLQPGDPDTVVSHPGATFGGLVHGGSLTGRLMIDCVEAVTDYYRDTAERLRWKVVPRSWFRSPADDESFALTFCRYALVRRDLSVEVPVLEHLPASKARAADLRKAEKHQLWSSDDAKHLPAFWQVLESNLQEQHGVTPTHSLEQISDIFGRCPTSTSLVVVGQGDHVLAGGVIFDSPWTTHTQYLGASLPGRDLRALDVVIARAYAHAQARGSTTFSFGSCSDDEGRTLNQGLFAYKRSFGGQAVVFDTYELGLAAT